MKQLSPSARRLFELARGQDEPDALARNRVARALSVKIASGAGLATPAASAPSAGLWAIAIKSTVVVGITGALAAAGWVALRRPAAPPAMAPHESAMTAKAPARPYVELIASAPLPGQPGVPEPSAIKERATGPVRRKLGRPSTGLEPRRPEQGLQDGDKSGFESQGQGRGEGRREDELGVETEALRLAQRALRYELPQEALRLLDEQDVRFRHGLLHQERAAARVLALCQAGRADEARAQALRFERTWPRSALVARIRSACWTR